MVNLFCFDPLLTQFLFLSNSEEKMLLQVDLAGKVLYLLTLIVLLLLYLRKWKRNVQSTGRANVVRGDGGNGGETISSQIAREVRAVADDTMGSPFAGEVRSDVDGGDDGGTITGEIAMGPLSLATTMPLEFN